MDLTLALYLATILLATLLQEGLCIGCFMCSSYNFSDPTCHDPFHPAWGHYEPNCLQGHENRVGEFPTTYCIKMKGINVLKKTELVVRRCSIFDMNNQCGVFVFEGQKYDGCLRTCVTRACNTSASVHGAIWLTGVLMLLVYALLRV